MKAKSKFLFLLLMVFFYSTCVNAQVQKGAILVGGSMGFQFQGKKDVSTFNLNILPRVGYFTGKHFMLGANLGYTFNQEKTTSTTGTGAKVSSFVIDHGLLVGPMFRPYYMLGSKAAVFTNISPMFGMSEARYGKTVKDARNITNSFVWQIGPGIDFFATKNVAIEVSVYYQGSYNHNFIKDNNQVIPLTANSYVVHGVNMNLGFNYFFIPKPKETVAPASTRP